LVTTFIRYVLPILPHRHILDPAAGDNRIIHAVRAAGWESSGSDLYPQDGSAPRDFLNAPLMVSGAVMVTNPPGSALDAFINHGLELIDRGDAAGLVLLMRNDHLQATKRIAAFNRATIEIHCNWRTLWVPGTKGNPRWSHHWLVWLPGQPRRPPIYAKPPAGWRKEERACVATPSTASSGQ
jgi:hypothetical protein